MREANRTARERIASLLRDEPQSASALARELELRTEDVLDHIEHVARSFENREEEFLVAPPACTECGFDEFDNLLNLPSRCPECKSEAIEEPVFTVE